MGLYKEGKMYGRDLFYDLIYPYPLVCFIFPIRKVYTRPAGLWEALGKILPGLV
jgi:hypothetical protein